MTNFRMAKIEAHKKNIKRYSHLLVSTPVTEAERRFLHKRIAQERGELARLEILDRSSGSDADTADMKTLIAAQSLQKRNSGRSHA